MKICRASADDAVDWTSMRQALWPNGDATEHAGEIADLLADPGNTVNLIARLDDGTAAGFAEASLRHDYVNGCETSPVGFLEGIFVKPDYRGRGIAARMVSAAESWARERGCEEFASDADLGNTASHAMHKALGFSETQRVVYFRKRLGS